MQKHFKRESNSLSKILKFIRMFKDKHQLDASVTFTIELILEEIFSNILKYNLEKHSKVLIELRLINQIILIKITYDSKQPFDISKSERYDATAALEQRPVGKLGLHLVKNLADQVSYQYQEGQSKITIKKGVKDLHV